MKWNHALIVMVLAIGPALLIGGATPASGVNGGVQDDFCPPGGTIAATVTIVGNTRLTCDVQCSQATGPCISFGRSGIKLELNGFRMTGIANEPSLTNCATDFAPFDGIQSTHDEVVIEGPGVVEGMRRHGIAFLGSTANSVEKALVKEIVSHQNCFSGIFMGVVNNSVVEGVVSVKNGRASDFRPCGGICVTNSSNNHIRRSEVAGNGSTAHGPQLGHDFPNDFGIGLVGASNGNAVEENGIGGNINGLALLPLGGATPAGNLIQKNVIAGNPPIQISAGGAAGADIRDLSVAGSNTFRENLCMTYIGASPNPCLVLPGYAGHQNN